LIHNTIILPVVLYRHETWSLTTKEEHRLRVVENMVLRRIFGLKRVEVMEKWRKLHNKELHNLHSSPSIIQMNKSRKMRWAWHVARMGEEMLLVGKSPLERPRHRRADSIKMDLEYGVVWTRLVWLRIGTSGELL
jgi:hypothetical protein